MLKEFNPSLAEQCEDLYAEMVDDVLTDLLKIFPYRAIPDEEENADCEDFVDYLGKKIYTGSGSLRDLPEINFEAGQFSRKAVENMTPRQHFLADCYFAETTGKLPTAEDLHVSIMENLDQAGVSIPFVKRLLKKAKEAVEAEDGEVNHV
jgi:hypothetical protein